jgi:hypothetical protein
MVTFIVRYINYNVTPDDWNYFVSLHVRVPVQDSTIPFGYEEFRLTCYERPVWPIEIKALRKYLVVQLVDVIRIAPSLTYLTA